MVDLVMMMRVVRVGIGGDRWLSLTLDGLGLRGGGDRSLLLMTLLVRLLVLLVKLLLLSLLSLLLLPMPLLVLHLLAVLSLLSLLVRDALGVDLRRKGTDLCRTERVSARLVELERPRVSLPAIVPFGVNASLPVRFRSLLPDRFLIQARSRARGESSWDMVRGTSGGVGRKRWLLGRGGLGFVVREEIDVAAARARVTMAVRALLTGRMGRRRDWDAWKFDFGPWDG